MRQVYHNLCTYSADLFGINSALYELGGLIVMHDASGCNSTYNTHDEPRWYTMDSMVYVSGLNEKDAILGNDQRIIDDICAVAEKEHPKFIVLSLSVLPAYMGTDVRGIMRLVEKRTGIPSFGFATNGMDTYIRGAGLAFRAIAERYCTVPAGDAEVMSAGDAEAVSVGDADSVSGRAGKSGKPQAENNMPSLNLLGVTPLDFSVNGNVEALAETISEMGFSIQSNWAMGSSLGDLQTATQADVNLVVSATGLPAAEYFYETWGIPFVTGFPCGENAVPVFRKLLILSSKDRQNRSFRDAEEICLEASAGKGKTTAETDVDQKAPAGEENGFAARKIRLIGEAVHCASIRFFLEQTYGCRDVRILCPLEEDAGVLRETDFRAVGEEEIAAFLNEGEIVIGDPIYKRVLRSGIFFVDDPHDAYSGRMYHDRGRIFVGAQADLALE